jgi:osmotically-inducible protein OsmY
MRISLPAAIIVVLGILGVQTPVWGQGTRTMSGTSTTGSLFSSSGGFASSTGTSGGILGTTGGSSSTLSSGLSLQQQAGFVGTTSQDIRTQGFVGAAQAGQTTGRQTGSGLSRTGSGLSQTGSGLTSGRQTRTTRTNRTATAGGAAARGRGTTTGIRATLRVAFSRPETAPGPGRVNNTLVQLLSRSPRVQALSPIQVLVQGRTATLRGVVATDYDRALAEQVTRLEPGISQVRNELVVAVAPAEPELAPPGEAAELPAAPPGAP